MKRIMSLILTLTMISLILISCGDREYNENEVREAAGELIADSVLLNDIYFGDGIPYSEDKNTSDGVYYEAIYAYHSKMGFNTIAELRDFTRETFSDSFSDYVFSITLNNVQDGDKAIILSRYYQKFSAADLKTPEAIMVNSTWKPILIDEVDYDLESIKVLGSEGEIVKITVDATVKRSGYDPQKRTIEIDLIEEDDGWRLNTPTYLNYDTTNINK